VACDFFGDDTVRVRRLYVLSFIDLWERRHPGRPVRIGGDALAAWMEVLDSSPPPVNIDSSDDPLASSSDSEPDGDTTGAARRTAGCDRAFDGPALRTGTDERSQMFFLGRHRRPASLAGRPSTSDRMVAPYKPTTRVTAVVGHI
jgi:hypothetical protein